MYGIGCMNRAFKGSAYAGSTTECSIRVVKYQLTALIKCLSHDHTNLVIQVVS